MFRALCCCLDDDDDVADDAPRERDANDRRRRDRDARVGALADENRVGTTTTADGSLRAMILDGNDDGDGDTDDEDDEDGGRLLPHASRRSDGAFFGDGGEDEREWEARRARAAALERSESAPPRGKLTRSDGDFVGENGKEEAMRRWVNETERRLERHRRAASVGSIFPRILAACFGFRRDITSTTRSSSMTGIIFAASSAFILFNTLDNLATFWARSLSSFAAALTASSSGMSPSDSVEAASSSCTMR